MKIQKLNESMRPSQTTLDDCLQDYLNNAFGYNGIEDYVDTQYPMHPQEFKAEVVNYIKERKNESLSEDIEHCWFGYYLDRKGDKKYFYMTKDVAGRDPDAASEYMEDSIPEPFTKFVFQGSIANTQAEKQGFKLVESKSISTFGAKAKKLTETVESEESELITQYINDGEFDKLEKVQDGTNVIWKLKEPIKESIEIANIADYIVDHYDFDDIDDKYNCINSIKDSFKDEKTISEEELEQFIGAHNGKDKVEESINSSEPAWDEIKAMRYEEKNKPTQKWFDKSFFEFYNDYVIRSNPAGDGYDVYSYDSGKQKLYLEDEGFATVKDAKLAIDDWYSQAGMSESFNRLRNEEGKLCADKWYADNYPDDETGIEQLNGLFMDDILKDRSIIDHCDTQVKDRVYQQLDKYIPFKPISEEYSDLKKGEWVEYNLSVKPGVKHIIPVRVDSDNGSQFNGWAWGEGFHTYQKSRIVGKIDMDDTDEIIKKYSLNEASYGGAFDIEDDQFFTRDDIEDAAEYVIDHINETFEDRFVLGGTWFENGKWIVNVQTEDGMEEYEQALHIDMRKIRAPRDLKDKFNLDMATALIKDIKELKYDIHEDIDDEITEDGGTFIEGGEEYKWLDKRVSSHQCKDSQGFNEEWFIAWAKSLEDGETYYFIIDENDFIDWGPCYSYQEALEFMTSKQSDYDDVDESLNEESERSYIDEAHEMFQYKLPKLASDVIENLDNWKDYKVSYITNLATKFYNEVGRYCHQLGEPLDESVTDDAQVIEDGPKVGMASVVNDLIRDEYEAIDAYNAAIATAQAEGFEDAAKVLSEIQAEENIHVGQLQEVMKLFDPNADKVEDGQAEGSEQLSNPIATNIDEELETEDSIFNKFVEIEKDLNDGEAVTAVIDKMVADNKDNPTYEKAYQRWLNK